MNILHVITHYGNLTGSEMYVYELSREQAKKHKVYIQSTHTQGELLELTKRNGVEVIDWNKRPKIDVIHAHQAFPAKFALLNYKTPVVQTIHSEILPDYEHPVEGCEYISIRPPVTEFVKAFGYKPHEVCNPFDVSRFKVAEKKSNTPPKVVFVGGVDYLRSQAINDLLQKHQKGELELIGVGSGWENLPVQSHKPTFYTENIIKECDFTAGINVGRTTIEGWLCGLPAVVYQVGESGAIEGIQVVAPPKDLTMFDSTNVTTQIEEIYAKIQHSDANNG